MENTKKIERIIDDFLEEDGAFSYLKLFESKEHSKIVKCNLKIKSDCVLSGLEYFSNVFEKLSKEKITIKNDVYSFEGKKINKSDQFQIQFDLPFNVAVAGERVALNLLSRMSAISTLTEKFVALAKPFGIGILDTRKTTPGLRLFEKYAVTVGGGLNHRFSLVDAFMIKDNHKNYYNGIIPAIDIFNQVNNNNLNLIVEIHSIDEFNQIKDIKNVRHLLLDNFSPREIKDLIKLKKDKMIFEVSGGVNEANIKDYLIDGINFISIGALTHNPPPIDLSLKIKV